MIALENVRCGYGARAVIEGFSATVAAGRVTSLLGPNGVGKSTLFKTILGVQPLLGGTITINGRPVHEISRTALARLLGYVPQNQQNPFAFRVLDVVVMGRTARLGRFGSPGAGDRAKALEALEALGGAHLSERSFAQLSGGERQLTMIARALVQEPEFIMLDEPTSALDFGNQARVLDEIRRLADSGIGVLMTTHTPDHASLCGGDVILLQGESRYLTGPVLDVLTPHHLGDAYGVDVDVTYAVRDGERVAQCRPLLPSRAPRPD